MARYKIAPTKTNLFKAKQEQEFAKEGHRLLEQKREVLVGELMAMINKALEAQKDVDEGLREAYGALEQAVVRMGRGGVKAASRAVGLQAQINVRQREVIGVHLPVIDVTFEDHPPYYSLRETSLWLDESVHSFKNVLKLLGSMAQLKISVFRIAEEVRKTIRRVNALEKIYLPDYEETIKYIENVLDEQGREAFFVLKLIKSRLGEN
jgi:V/A-type H+-transporting ATPase subunit D